ncbi:Uncharacterised protein [Mycolicibacterium flavescens]|nr:Uncharacterised protein [Mycolicibacterium flavescens]
MSDMKIQILRVIGTRARQPTVLAIVDGYAVRWSPKEDWSCTCDELEFVDCPHIPAVENLLDPRVTGAKK